MWPFTKRCKHKWEIVKYEPMQHFNYRQILEYEFTRVWYRCGACDKVEVRNWRNHHTLEELRLIFPKP